MNSGKSKEKRAIATLEGKETSAFQKALLTWYDKYRRDLPWRAKDRERPDPYKVWLSEIMLQQTTVPAVKSYFEKFIRLWPTVNDLAVADSDRVMKEWAGLGYYARARNLLKCAETVRTDYDGVFPSNEAALIKLPGIGPYTAAAISSIAFNQEAVVIDGNVDRIVARLFCISTPFPEGKKQVRQWAPLLYKDIGGTGRASDLPQALMDLGAMVCTPKSPSCGLCPVTKWCQGFHRQEASLYPLKKAKEQKETRTGKAYLIRSPDNKILIERRDENRMLGGMTGVPTSEWDKKNNVETIPFVISLLISDFWGISATHSPILI